MTTFPDLQDLIRSIDSSFAGVEDIVATSVFDSAPAPKEKYILVEVGSHSLAIQIDSLAEVGAVPKITFLPNLPVWILGIMNIRSEIISMVDFAGFLQEDQGAQGRQKKLVVLRSNKVKVGIAVDSIVATVTKNRSEILSSVVGISTSIGKDLFIESILVDGRSYAILDVDNLLTHPRLVDFSGES